MNHSGFNRLTKCSMLLCSASKPSSSFFHRGCGRDGNLIGNLKHFHNIPAANAHNNPAVNVHNNPAANGSDETQPFSLILPRTLPDVENDSNNLSRAYIKLGSGMILLKNYLSLSDQVDIVNICESGGGGPGGFYQPGNQSGSKLQLHMMCYGRNWDPETRYKKRCRSDGSEPPLVPDEFISLVETTIRDARARLDDFPIMRPDICLVNYYATTGRLAIHQDRDESPNSLKRGFPVVSVSIGDTAEFLYGHTKDKHKLDKVMLESGDVLVFGGKSRLIFHGVKAIIPDSAPLPLLKETMLRPGRLNLTFRQF